VQRVWVVKPAAGTTRSNPRPRVLLHRLSLASTAICIDSSARAVLQQQPMRHAMAGGR